ncbi:hypothetical protein [Nocardia jejuensis]|uniref:hypothetical protein n=1 Tax=Nocardia jejuensis TaxID=328049 RepID=UPI000833B500|nr:hypothetical protein [Nocardia jejuensis]
MGTSGLTGEIEHPFTIDPSSEKVTAIPGGAPVRAGVRVTPLADAGTGRVRVVVGVGPDSGLTFSRNELTDNAGASYPAGADSRSDTLSFDAVTVDSAASQELYIELRAEENASPEPSEVTFAVGAASCSVPVRIATDDPE